MDPNKLNFTSKIITLDCLKYFTWKEIICLQFNNNITFYKQNKILDVLNI